MGSYHVYWKFPLRPTNALWPGLWGHFSLTILPGIINGGTFERVQMLLLFSTGAVASFIVAYWGNPDTAFHEAPSLWCLIAIPQHAVTWLVVLQHRLANQKKRQDFIDGAHGDMGQKTNHNGDNESGSSLRRRQRL